MTESGIQSAIITYLSRCPNVFAWRNNSGVANIRGRVVRFGLPGSADIIGVWRGHGLAIEVKAANGKQSELQKRFQSKWEAAGGVYILARSVDDVRARLEL